MTDQQQRPDPIEELKRPATAEQRRAMDELERRGFRFLIDFGCQNAISRLEGMDWAFQNGMLYEHLRIHGLSS